MNYSICIRTFNFVCICKIFSHLFSQLTNQRHVRDAYIHTCMQLEMRDADDAIPGDPHGDSSQRKTHMRGQGHRKLKNVLVRGFPSAKGLVELTSHILESAASLKRLVLDTAYGCHTRDCIGICSPLTRKALLEARKAVDVIKTYIESKVPSSVKFKLIEPCAKCHADDA